MAKSKCPQCGKPLGDSMRQEAQYCSVTCKDAAWRSQRRLQRKYERALQCVKDIELMHTDGAITGTQYKTAMAGIRRAVKK